MLQYSIVDFIRKLNSSHTSSDCVMSPEITCQILSKQLFSKTDVPVSTRETADELMTELGGGGVPDDNHNEIQAPPSVEQHGI